MTKTTVSVEDYVGAIYRLKSGEEEPLPLAVLQEYFGFSPISIHEMVQKLVQRGLADYQPYHGVTLTESGNETALALIRRHRIWEWFLASELLVDLEQVHTLAGELEHAAPDWITERLFVNLGKPEACPHGSQISTFEDDLVEKRLTEFSTGNRVIMTRLFPKTGERIALIKSYSIFPGQILAIKNRDSLNLHIMVDENPYQIPLSDATCVWGLEANDEG